MSPLDQARRLAAGLLGLSGPRRFGGGGAPAAVVPEVQEVFAGACGATAFVAARYETPLAMLADSGNEPLQERLLPRLCSGQVLAVRAAVLDLLFRSATALVTATGGSAMSLDAAPQRLIREAVIALVQGQTAPVRETGA